jgi:hypothetical protein
MRRAGQNPTESEVQDMINKIDDGTASLAFEDFCLLMREKTKEIDPEILFKDTFRVFSKDEEGRGKLIAPSLPTHFPYSRLYSSRGDEVCPAVSAWEDYLQGDI